MALITWDIYLLLSSACTTPRSFLLLTLPQQRGGWGRTRTCQGTGWGHLTSADQRDIPHHMASCSGFHARGRRGKQGMIRVMVFVFLSLHYMWRSPGCPRNGWTPACIWEVVYELGSDKWIPCFVTLVCTTLAFPIKLSLPQCKSFLTSTLPILLPSLTGESEWVAVRGLAAGWA